MYLIRENEERQRGIHLNLQRINVLSTWLMPMHNFIMNFLIAGHRLPASLIFCKTGLIRRW